MSCQAVDQNNIRVSYSVTNANHAYLFRGTTAIISIGSGTKSNTVNVSNLSPNTSYTFRLRDGSSSLSPLLASATCRTQSAPTAPSASGTLSCQAVDQNNIRVSYSVTNATNASLFRGTSRIVAIGSGTKSNTVNVSNLSPNTSYTFRLRNGTSSTSPLLASATCRTQDKPDDPEPPQPPPPPQPPCPPCPHPPCPPCPQPPVHPCPTCPDPVHGVCGTRAQNYSYYQTNWPSGTTFCSVGTPSPTSPSFPNRGGSTTWHCLGKDGGSHAVCTATRDQKEDPDPDPSGNIECYSESENSITLIYSYSNGSDVSLFRKREGSSQTRIQTWYESFRTNRLFVDAGLREDTKYTYYLRNGTSVNSTLLGHAVCTTRKKEKEGVLTITKTVRNITRNSNWGNSVIASPGDQISFLITVRANSGKVENVSVKDILPEKIGSITNLRLNGASISGNILSGINIGDVPTDAPQVITFDARLYSEDQFGSGWTNLINRAQVFSKGVYQGEDTAEIYVSRGVVAGATTVPTGITNNKLIDFVLLPLLLTLIIWFFFKKHFVALSGWLERKRIDAVDFKAKRNLEKLTSQIKIKEKFN